MVTEIVYSVLRDNTNRRVTIMPDESSDKGTAKAKAKKGSTSKAKASDTENETASAKPKRTRKASTTTKEQTAAAQTQPVPTTTQAATGDELIGTPCPLCGKGHIIKGKTAYGCSEWKTVARSENHFKVFGQVTAAYTPLLWVKVIGTVADVLYKT